MPATIIIRIEDEASAKSVMAAGARDLAGYFLPSMGIQPSKVSITYRTPEDEAIAVAGGLEYWESKSHWP